MDHQRVGNKGQLVSGGRICTVLADELADIYDARAEHGVRNPLDAVPAGSRYNRHSFNPERPK